MKQVALFFDRDRTLIYDDEYHLGRQRQWRSLVRILPGVITGLKRLRRIPHVKLYMITNQPGVAIQEFPLLTEERAEEVCKYVLTQFKQKGVGLDGYRICGKASPSYTKKHTEYTFDPKKVGNFTCFKPGTGMVTSLLKQEKFSLKTTTIYVIGDRASDVQTALNTNGVGILVPSVRLQEREDVQRMRSKRTYLASSFLDACQCILEKEKRS